LLGSYISTHDPDYPVGRSRLEAISVLATASIMSLASVEVIQYAATDLYYGVLGDIPHLHVSITMYIILGVGIFLKLVLWFYCSWVHRRTRSDSMEALAEDHFNDVLSNIAAVVTAAIAASDEKLWWVDPFGAILISVVIVYRWFNIIHEQIKKVVGFTAPPEFVARVDALAREHDSRLEVDCTRAYHFGCRCKLGSQHSLLRLVTGHLDVVMRS
jgi:divalent metal cation (Fe/Co/Zn/Cd) transporter